MSFLSNAFRRRPDGLPPWAALDQESLRISAAMEHIRDHGNLDSFPGNQNEKLALMLTASRQGLVKWDRAGERYELTSLGRERLGMRGALQKSGGPMNLPPASAAPAPAGRFFALGSGTILAGIAGVAIGAAAVAWLPGSSKLPPRDRAAVAASKPSDASDVGTAPRRDEASAARNPGIPCLAEKCLETGGSAERPAQQAANPEQARNAPPPAPAPASAKPEPSEVQAQQPAGVHPGQAGAAEGALLAQQLAPAAAEPAPPAPRPPRRAAERARTHEAAPASNPEQPGYAQSTGEPPARAADKSSRNRHAATESRQSWSESKRKPSKSRREYIEEEAGEPEQGAIVRRYPEHDDGPPSFATRRYRGEQAGRRGADEDNRPGYGYREPQNLGYREGPPRFGLFDWLFR
ncbi:MAG: hypothetical protein E6G88_13730 [Alphaproteobacteria bacterium]|nr:MAG: hypothetical protein E6G88_13730 [Alphaproteobacteria bacterium]